MLLYITVESKKIHYEDAQKSKCTYETKLKPHLLPCPLFISTATHFSPKNFKIDLTKTFHPH